MPTLEQRIYDGDQARLVLENEAFTWAFDEIRKEYLEAWTKSPARDAEGREKLFLMYSLTNKLQATLEAALADGKIAKVALQHQADQLARDRAEGVLNGSM